MKQGRYDAVPLERVRWGTPAADAVAEESERLGAKRVFVVASGTLSRKTNAIGAIRRALGDRDAGLFDECKEHTPLESVIACVQAVRAASADLIATVGGGSPIDMVKVVQLCLTHDVHDIAGLKTFAGKPTTEPSAIRQIIAPTTLSGGEYSSMAGATDTARKMKDMYAAPDMCGRVIMLDPALVRHTPQWLWLSTAIRALDHAVEGYCALSTNALVQGTALQAMKLFAQSLPATRHDADDLEARQSSQMAVWLAASSLGRVPMGASHGIGYLLGTLHGVPHGYTSCVMLPAVLKWNAPVLGTADNDIATALGQPEATASEAVGALIAALGLPRTLGDVGVKESDIAQIAAFAARHPVVRANPRPVESAADAEAILRLAL
ncbi:MAG TPA: iron-containing alcohol dehydrogenase [Rhizomicrobium sp.]|jgi:alcohol dehydrogenase class IV